MERKSGGDEGLVGGRVGARMRISGGKAEEFLRNLPKFQDRFRKFRDFLFSVKKTARDAGWERWNTFKFSLKDFT